MNRVDTKDESEIIYSEVFEYTNALLDQMEANLPWKVVKVPRAEADDVMLVLAREYNEFEKILIHSPDKDMIQAQRNTDNVFQYSSLTSKWLEAETKGSDMNDWVQKHVVLGDASDGVPRIVDGTEFSENFIKYLKENNIETETPLDFRESDISKEEKIRLITEYDVYVLNKKKESTGIKDIYFKPRFGPTDIQRRIKKFGSLDDWLDSHPLYRPHYVRNFKLVMEEGIPNNIWTEIIIDYKSAKTEYNMTKFENYLKENNLRTIMMSLPNVFKLDRSLTAEDFGW